MKRANALGAAISVLVLSLPVAAQLRVNVMPGYPNAPKTDPSERRQVRPGVAFYVFGSAEGGVGLANGATYTWSFGANPNVQVVAVDGNLSGTVANDRYIAEEVIFNLVGPTTVEILTATLAVSGAGGTGSDTLEFLVISTSDPSSDTPLEALQIDANVAIEEGLRWLYANQNTTNGSWAAGTAAGGQPCGGTAFAVWAFENQKHYPGNDVNEDIYAEWVQKGLNYLFANLQVLTGATAISAPRADTARGAVANGISDLNQNNQVINACPGGNSGYATPIACSAIIASLAPHFVVTTGPATGLTYKQVVEDVIDWLGHTQNQGGTTTWSGRGGWNYNPGSTQTRSDMSINSWAYLAMEGAESVFLVDVPDWIKQECEHALVAHQTNAVGPQGFGYEGPNQCLGGAENKMATTGGGLSGLFLSETEGPHVMPGQIIVAAAAPLNTIAAKRQAGIDFLGANWQFDSTGAYCRGNRRNYYVMWTVARALRLSAAALGLPAGQKVPLVNGGVTFDWETGEENGSGNVPGAGSAREGYFNYLVRNQIWAGTATQRGRWSSGLNWLSDTIETACASLILTPTVFTAPGVPAFQAPTPCSQVLNGSVAVPLSFTVSATDSDPGDLVTLTATGAPAGASFTPPFPATGNPATAVFNWTPAAGQAGPWTITLTATDIVGHVTQCTVNLFIVDTPPAFVPPTPCNQTFHAFWGVEQSFTITVADTDPGDVITLFESGLPTLATLNPPLPASGTGGVSVTMQWTPQLTQIGSHTIIFSAVDLQGHQVNCPIQVQVGECYLGIGSQMLNHPIQGSGGDVLLITVDYWWPVAPGVTPTLYIANDPGIQGAIFYAQVGLRDPLLFPGDPWKMSNGVQVTIGVGWSSYGPTTQGINLWLVEPPGLGTSTHLDFTIDGL